MLPGGRPGAQVEFVTRQHSMERIQFTGGYLRNLPEEKPETILRQAPDGARGMIFGKREINGLEWAKVATRDGITGWYTVPARPGASATTKRENLKISKDAYETTYPQVTGKSPPGPGPDQPGTGQLHRGVPVYDRAGGQCPSMPGDLQPEQPAEHCLHGAAHPVQDVSGQ